MVIPFFDKCNIQNSNMFRLRALLVSITSLLTIINKIHCLGKGPNCTVKSDPVFNGSFVDCSNMKLTQQDLSKLPFVGVTTLDISYNNIGFLPDYTFDRFKHLKCLVCTRCILDGMGKYSLKGLDTLEVLRLDNNRLVMVKWSNKTQARIPPGVFRYVPMLKQLYIDHNGKYDISPSGYSEYLDIFKYLPRLTHLSIDSFKTLVVGKEFLVFTELYSLNISCHSLKSIHNDSLKGFRNSTVKIFELNGGDVLHQFNAIELDVFQHLPDVAYLSLQQIRVGNQNVLKMMRPLVGRQIFTIRFDSVFSAAFSSFESQVTDTTVTSVDAQYLRAINVSNFLWYDSGVYSLEYDLMLSLPWQHNLKSVVIETDALLQTNVLLVYRMMLMKKLEVFAYLGGNVGFRNQFIDYFMDTENPAPYEFIMNPNSTYPRNIELSARDSLLMEERDSSVSDIGPYHNLHYSRRNQITREKKRIRSESDGRNINKVSFVQRAENDQSQKRLPTLALEVQSENQSMITSNYVAAAPVERHISFAPPPNLRSIIVDGMHYVHLKSDYVFTVYKNQVETIIFSNAKSELSLKSKVYGLENLTTISCQGSQHLDMSLNFLESFPGIKNLDLGKTSVTPVFYEQNVERLLESLKNMEYLNLEENELRRLPTDMFRTNNKMKHVCLAKNRFSNIPFSLEFTPALEILDLTGNSIVTLSFEDRAAIDSHILSVENFTILLNDNKLSCTCSNILFITWLQSRRQHFDQDGNYTCISEDGVLSYTGSHMDIKVFWRQCRGGYYLLVSAILACSLVAVYLAMILGVKKKTEIISRVMRVIVPGFRLMTRADYRYGVFIGYANEDVMYVRNTLLRYIEDKWRLNAFVHQRDLHQDRVEMNHALRDSWRCLLLVTETFLYDCDMAHNTMKSASFFVSPLNPQSLVVLVEENVRHRLPDYVLHVVDEDNIMVVPSLDPVLDYETKEFLRTRLAT